MYPWPHKKQALISVAFLLPSFYIVVFAIFFEFPFWQANTFLLRSTDEVQNRGSRSEEFLWPFAFQPTNKECG